MEENTIRIGRVSTVNASNGTVQVIYKDKDNAVTKAFPVFNLNGEYKMPAVDELVLVLHLSNGTSAGIVLGSYWNKNQSPVETGEALFRKELGKKAGEAFQRYKEGEYREKASKIVFECDAGTISVEEILKRLDDLEKSK